MNDIIPHGMEDGGENAQAEMLKEHLEKLAQEPCSVERTSRTVIEHKLLTSLGDGDTIAALLTKQDVQDLIDALEGRAPDGVGTHDRRKNFVADLKQLLREAFST